MGGCIKSCGGADKAERILEFPGGLAVKDSVLSLLRHWFNPWPRDICRLRAWLKEKERKKERKKEREREREKERKKEKKRKKRKSFKAQCRG